MLTGMHQHCRSIGSKKRKHPSNPSLGKLKSRKGAIGFTLPKAQIDPVKGIKTTFDALLEKHQINEESR